MVDNKYNDELKKINVNFDAYEQQSLKIFNTDKTKEIESNYLFNKKKYVYELKRISDLSYKILDDVEYEFKSLDTEENNGIKQFMINTYQNLQVLYDKKSSSLIKAIDGCDSALIINWNGLIFVITKKSFVIFINSIAEQRVAYKFECVANKYSLKPFTFDYKNNKWSIIYDKPLCWIPIDYRRSLHDLREMTIVLIKMYKLKLYNKSFYEKYNQ